MASSDRGALGQVGGHGGGERTARAVVVARRHPCARQDDDPSGPATTSSAESVRWPPLTTTQRAPRARSCSATAAAASSGPSASTSCGRARRPRAGSGWPRARGAPGARGRPHPVGLDERVSGRGDEHGVDDEVGEAPLGRQCGHLGHDAGVRQHPRLHAADSEVVEDRLDLVPHEGRLERDDAADLGRVLRGDRRQRAGAVDAERGEGLEVGLRARTAPRVRPGDRERRGWRGVVRHRAHHRRAPG